jgi:hypothetical protein
VLAGGPRSLRIASYLIAELSRNMELAADGAAIEARFDVIHFALLFNVVSGVLPRIMAHFVKTHFIQLLSFLQIRFPLDDLVNFAFGARCHFSFCCVQYLSETDKHCLGCAVIYWLEMLLPCRRIIQSSHAFLVSKRNPLINNFFFSNHAAS